MFGFSFWPLSSQFQSRYALDRLGDGHISKFVLEEDASPAENQGANSH